MYHPHVDEMTQTALGMMGMIVVHAHGGDRARVRDYALMTHEMMVPIGAARAQPLAMNAFNVLTFDGKAFPATDPLVAEIGDMVRIRIGNLGPMDHHPIHLHGHAFEVVATDGGVVRPSARVPETTVLVPTGTVRVIEFRARAAGLALALPYDSSRYESDGTCRGEPGGCRPSGDRCEDVSGSAGVYNDGWAGHARDERDAYASAGQRDFDGRKQRPARRHRYGRHVHRSKSSRSSIR